MNNEVLYIETEDGSYSVAVGRTGFKRALEREKKNPDVILIKRVKFGGSNGRVLYIRPRVERTKICDSSNRDRW